jgi:hypothetical protein
MANVSTSFGGMRTIDVPLDALPIVIHTDNTASGIFMIVFGFLLCGMPLLFVESVSPREHYPMCLLFLALGALLFFLGLHALTNTRHLTIDGQQVACREGSCFGRRDWTEPLGTYQGIWYGMERRSTGGKVRRIYMVHVLRLFHADKERCVVLYESLGDAGLRRRWEEVCRLLNLPALEGPARQF